jgi:hypothetical protein
MPTPKLRSTAGAFAGAAAALWLMPAYPHAVCGDRIFPATLAIDDPGVTDELTLPTVQWLPQNADGVGELDASGSWAKTIFPNLALSVGAGPTWLHSPNGFGWDALDTEAKYQFMCIPQLEFMASARFDVSWGGMATGAQLGSPNAYSPGLDVGLGFGALPTSMNFLRLFAITAEISTTTPGQAVWNGDMFPDQLQLGLHASIQPALLQFARRRNRRRLRQASHSDCRIRLLHANRQRGVGDLGRHRDDPTRRGLHGGQMATRRRSGDPRQQRKRTWRRRGGQP